jgi:hypothetical protein
MLQAILTKSNLATKKYKVIITDKDGKSKTIHFGQKGALDFTSGKRTEQERLNYLKRHRVNEDFNNLLTAGFWSANLLWTKPTINEAIKDVESKFNIKIKF